MAQTKIYPATQAQAQTIIDKVDAIDAKIVTPNYQDKTVTPSDVQQIVQADNGYNALHSVTVEPIAAAMPENLEAFIMNDSQEPYSLSLSGNVPAYACYNKTYLKRVYGNITSVNTYSFYNCNQLQEVNFSNLTVINGDKAFSGCNSLEIVNLPILTTFGSFYTFSGCARLKEIYAPNAMSSGSYLLSDCPALEKCIVPRLSYLVYGTFTNNSNLKYVDYSIGVRVGGQAFMNCSKLELLDLSLYTGSSPVLDNVNAFSNTNDTWIAVVANDTVKAAFQSATNWSTYASHIKSIAEVEAEVGMTYDEYYLQCFGHPRFDN